MHQNKWICSVDSSASTFMMGRVGDVTSPASFGIVSEINIRGSFSLKGFVWSHAALSASIAGSVFFSFVF